MHRHTSNLLLLAPLSIGNLAQAFRLPAIIQNVFHISQPTKSAVPQFILDADHPWLSNNKKWLNQFPDVRAEICDKQSSLWLNYNTSKDAPPPDLFRKLEIDNNRYEISRLGWKMAEDRLREMMDCPAALQDARTLHIDIYVHDSQYSDYTECSVPPVVVPRLLAEVLSRMESLERLDFGVTGRSSAAFKSAFEDANVNLSAIKYLQPGGYSDWLLRFCPNVEVLVAGSYFDHWSWNEYDEEMRGIRDPRETLIDAIEGLPLKELTLSAGSTGWTKEMLESIHKAVPNITVFGMDGGLMGNRFSERSDIFNNCLSVLSRFQNLEDLSLPDVSDLRLGFDGGPGCGNAFFGRSGRAYGRELSRQIAGLTDEVAIMVHDTLPQLKSLKVGGQSANITVNDVGEIDILWPWTGRMEDWTYEMWPETPDNDLWDDD